MTARRGHNERGSETIEAVIIVPAFLLFIALVIAAGRVGAAHQGVKAAAAEAARGASVSRTQSEAASTATSQAEATLANQGLNCISVTVTADTSGFNARPGQPASVTATVSCTLNLSDLTAPGLPGSKTITATMSSPIDTYRERS